MIDANMRIGFMQGRLCDCVDGKIQAFPWGEWESEFAIAPAINLNLMEWTLDHDGLHKNPLMTTEGREKIRSLCNKHGVLIPSLTGDCFMQAPLWKATGAERIELENIFISVVKSCVEVGISVLVVPLVDNGRLDNIEQENNLILFLESQENYLLSSKVTIAFESDYGPNDLARFIKRLNPLVFGINYDIGNSAALGFDPREEFRKYGEYVKNVHVKDRKLGGATVPLGLGNANFDLVFGGLSRLGYKGNFILQTARAKNKEHAKALSLYRDQTITWLKKYAP